VEIAKAVICMAASLEHADKIPCELMDFAAS